jgi:hypothetical protein
MAPAVSEPLRDIIGRILYAEPGAAREDWYTLSEGRREPWRMDADRVLDRLGNELADIWRVVVAAKAFVDSLSEDDAGEKYLVDDIHNGPELAELVGTTINCTEDEVGRLLSALYKAKEWKSGVLKNG